MLGYFVTGTDTNVGKTWATVALIQAIKAHGYKVVGMKPVAAGCHWQDGRLKNEDALLLQQFSNVQTDYPMVNPYAYAEPVSPHIAGKSQPASIAVIRQHFQRLSQLADVVVVEGAGGWFSPLAQDFENAALAQQLGLPVILVVAIRLGCINQALLTWSAMQQAKVPCYGWIAVCIEAEMMYLLENITFLQQKITMPLLGVLPHMAVPDFEFLASCLQIKNR